MPEIEVTLDEIKGTTLKTQADVDRLMRDFSKPETKRDVLSGLPGGATGFLDNIIKGLTSKGIMGGLAAGGAAGGVLVLVDVIKNLTKQSKILTTVQETVGKALGLLVDLVLLPFLPIIIGALMQLYMGITQFGAWWKDIWDTVQKEGLGGLIKLTLEWAWGSIEKWKQNFLNWIFSDEPIEKKTLDVIKGIADAFLDTNVFLLPFTWRQLLGWIFGEGYSAKGSITFGILPKWVADASQFILDVLSWIFGVTTTAINNKIDFSINLLKGNPSDWLWGILEQMPGIGPGISAVHSVMGQNKSSGGSATGDLGLPKPFSSGSVTVTNNFNGFTIDQLPGIVNDVFRQATDRIYPGSG